MARTYHVDAMRSWLVIGEVQALLNPMSVLVNAEYPPARPVLWTVVAIVQGVGAGGACPLPAQGGGTRRSLLVAPTPPGPDNLPERTGRALTNCPRQGSRPFSEEVDD